MKKSVSKISTFTAASLGEFFEIIHTVTRLAFSQRSASNGYCGQLWFRAQPKWEYSLLPNAFRKANGKGASLSVFDADTRWTKGNLQELWNFQRFQARAFHMVKNVPDNSIGWQEVSQHYGGLTRYLDWSESAFTALKFSLEDFLLDKPVEHENTPCVWLLNPYLLNSIGYEFFAGGDQYAEDAIRNALTELPLGDIERDSLVAALQKRLKTQQGSFCPPLRDVSEENMPIIGLPNLSALEEMRQACAGTMPQKLQSGEVSPYFYLLTRYYGDALLTPAQGKKVLPPLAVLQPYHSVRIQAQHGAFTVFPNYQFFADSDKMLNEIALDRQEACHEAIACIRLLNPARMASEIRAAGGSAADLYPELEQLEKRADDPPFEKKG